MLFGGGQIPAVIATVIYALPPLVRCTTLGIRELPEEINEVSTSFGASTTQTLTKVKIPMAIPAIMVGINWLLHHRTPKTKFSGGIIQLAGQFRRAWPSANTP